MTIGIYLMSRIGVTTGAWEMSAYMFVFGAGLGLVMSVLVVAAQNAVPYEELGVATSSTTFFRMIGGSFGTAVFGAVFANLLTGNLVRSLHGVKIPAGAASQIDNPTLVSHLPPVIHAGVVEGVAHTIQTVFFIGVPISAVAFLLSWLLPEIPLRRSIRTVEPAEGFVAPEGRSSLEEVRLALERVTARENRAELYRALAERAGLDLPPPACWLLYRLADRPDSTVEAVAADLKVAPEQIEPGVVALAEAGMVTGAGGPPGNAPAGLRLTPAGQEAVGKLTAARRAGLTELLEGWDPEAHPEVMGMVRSLAEELLADDEKLLADARPGSPSLR